MLLTRIFKRRKQVADVCPHCGHTDHPTHCRCWTNAALALPEPKQPTTIVVNVPATVDGALAAQYFEQQLKRRGIA